MAEILTALLTYGPLGIFCAVLWLAYIKEKESHDKDMKELHEAASNDIKHLNDKIQTILEGHAASLDAIRKAQNDREKEISSTLQSYGTSVVTAVEQASELSEKLWSIRK